jgi:hypothetical protein
VVIEPVDAGTARVHLLSEREWASRRADLEPKAAVVLRQTDQLDVPGTKLSFARLGRRSLEEVMRQAGRELSRLSSFQGFAIHSYESYRRWLTRPGTDR